MNRRKALVRMAALSGGTGLAYAGWEGYKRYKAPALSDLKNYEPLIVALAETIIPATDTPGAKEAGVSTFIIKMITDCTARPSQNNFMSGLAGVMNDADAAYGSFFENCTMQQRTSILKRFEQNDAAHKSLWQKLKQKFAGDSFFITLKKYTVIGYCTSQQGATMAFNYDPVPGRYIAAQPVSPGQKAWATQ